MFKKINLLGRNNLHFFSAIFLLLFFILSISQTVFTEASTPENPYLVGRFFGASGKQLDKVSFPGRPPKYFRMPAAVPLEPNIAMGTNTLGNVPAFYWSYGCSATSGAMMAGYYDRNGYPNMYDGPENGGVCPLDNDPLNVSWGQTVYPGVTCGECPLSATHLGEDALTDSGHVDDYWVDYLDPGPDPYLGNWAEHVSADCTGDFMKTNRAAYGNSDGSTWFFFYTDGSPTPYADLEAGGVADYDGGCGLADFFESRGYTVTSMYNQYIQGIGSNPSLGFTYAQFQAEIDAGRPVLIHLEGHTMLGYGYSTTGSLVYIHDTWDYSSHTMTWGSSYGGYLHMGVTVIELSASFEGTVMFDADSYSAPDTAIVTVWDSDLDITGNADTTTVEIESALTADTEIMELTETDTSTGIFTVDVGLELNAVPASDSILQVQDGDTILVTYEDADHDGLGTPETLTDTARISLISIPTGFTATAGRNYVFLYWNPVVSPVLTGYNVYRSTSLTGTKTKVNGTTLIQTNSFQDLYLSLDTTYYYWVTAVDIYDGETDYSQVAVVTTGEESGDGIIEPGDGDGGDGGGSSSSGGAGSLGCFVATASYGTPMMKEVIVLSQFRDEYLLTNPLGRFFVSAYYQTSPPIASFISKHPRIKNLVRWSLKPLVKVADKVISK